MYPLYHLSEDLARYTSYKIRSKLLYNIYCLLSESFLRWYRLPPINTESHPLILNTTLQLMRIWFEYLF